MSLGKENLFDVSFYFFGNRLSDIDSKKALLISGLYITVKRLRIEEKDKKPCTVVLQGFFVVTPTGSKFYFIEILFLNICDKFLMAWYHNGTYATCKEANSRPTERIDSKISSIRFAEGVFVPLMYWAKRLCDIPNLRAIAEAFSSG